jgi:glycosyltransferase involved in cell wall biosynthesis
MVKILWVGDSPTVDTGFGIVSNNIIKRLLTYGHEVVVLGINTFGDPYNQNEFPFKIYPCSVGSTENLYGMNKLWPIVEFEQPDLLFFLNDPWMIQDYLKRKPKNYPYMKTMAYFPTDAGPIKKEWAEMLTEFDAQVCYSKFAEQVVIESNGGTRPRNLYQIYHGVDTDIFKPINQHIARAALELDPNDFIVGMVARNQFRKRFDILMKAFAEFSKDKDDTKIYLHTALHDVGFDILDLARQFNLADRLILSEGVTPAKGVTSENLNLIYNSFSVNCLISLGDGFGLPVAESMAVGCPQLVSDHSCLKELVEGHGGLTIKTAAWLLHTNGINTWGGISDVKDLTDKLNLLYNNRELVIKFSEDGYNFITQPKFTWDYAAAEFNKIIRNIFKLL